MEFEFSRENIAYWAERYDSYYKQYNQKDKLTEERIKKILRSQRYLTQKNLRDIMVWKSPRIKHYADKNVPSTIKRITRCSLKTGNERNRIESLLGQKGGLKGVGYPVASTILHFAFPNKYPIMDFRVIRSLKSNPFNLKQPLVYGFDFWERYCGIIKSISEKYGLCIRTIDKALWRFDKEQNSRFNKCERDD